MSRTRVIDKACAEAVELARATAVADAPSGEVGEHLGMDAEGERIVTHYFACLGTAYQGWRWAVTVTRASRAKNVTVSESVLLPGPEALLAPEWVPWSDRLRPGDLGVGDILPTSDDDERLVPAFTQELDQQAIWEIGLGRARVLSALGRERAAHRWHSGDSGPFTPIAHAAPAQCSTCGFYWPLGGALRTVFGVCANEYAPDDGRVVSADHGCGAHSEAATAQQTPEAIPPILDQLGYDLFAEEGGLVAYAGSVDETEAGSVDDADNGDLGHS